MNSSTASWNMNGLIIEGTAGTGKSTAIRALLASEAWRSKAFISSIVLSEHQTMRVLEAKERLGTLRVQDHIALLNDIVFMLERFNNALSAMDWSERKREGHKLPFLLERFHFSHVFHYSGMKWDDVQEIDQRLAALNTKVCILTIDPQVMRQRIIEDTRKNGWGSFLHRFGNNEAEIIQHFARQQETLLSLCQRTKLSCKVIDTSNTPILKIVEEMLGLLGLSN